MGSLMFLLSNGSWARNHWKTWIGWTSKMAPMAGLLISGWAPSCGLSMWHGCLTSESWVLKRNSPRNPDGCCKASSDPTLEVMEHPPSSGCAGGMVHWGPSLETSCHNLLLSLPLRIQRPRKPVIRKRKK